MRFDFHTCAGLSALCFQAAGVGPVRSEPPAKKQALEAVKRGLDFVQKDADLWRKERKCSTCHHGTMTVWVLSAAKSRGYEVAATPLADTIKWTRDRTLGASTCRDKRPGWSMVNTPALYLSLVALSVPKQNAVSDDDSRRITGHLLRHQEADGSWSWSSAPAKNRPPPVFESDEVATLLGRLALVARVPTDPKEKSAIRAAQQKATAWLAKTPPTGTTQAAALRLLLEVRTGVPAKTLRAEIDRFLARQNKDGGWGQLRDAASDAYATGQALFVLHLAGVESSRAEIRRAVKFLVETQKEDGSWPMKRRGHPGVTPSSFIVPITYFGSAWATLGLVSAVPR